MVATDVTVLPDEAFVMDRQGPVPLYYQLADRLETAIRSGLLPSGGRLENELDLSARLGLSRPTVRRAIQELVDKGMLVRRRGVGTQVLHGGMTRQVELTSLWDDLERSRQTPSTQVLERVEMPADRRLADHMAVEEGALVVRFRRLRLADGTPLAILENYLPEEFIDVTTETLAERGLYEVLRVHGVEMRAARQRIGARKATAAEGRLLGLTPAAPVLTMQRTAYASTGRVVEYGDHCYRPDLYSFETTLVGR